MFSRQGCGPITTAGFGPAARHVPPILAKVIALAGPLTARYSLKNGPEICVGACLWPL